MSYTSGGSEPWDDQGQRSAYSPAEEKTGVFDNRSYARRTQDSRAPRQDRQNLRSDAGTRSFVLSPRGVSRRSSKSKKLNPLAVYAAIAFALALIMGIVLIVVLLSRGSSGGGSTPAPSPTQQSILVPTQPPVSYQTPPATATVIVTPPPSAEPTPVPTAAPTPAPTQAPIHTSTPVTDRTYTRDGILADAQAAAERDSHYSTVSEKDVELEVPAESAFLRTPILKKVYAGEEGKAIYIMPKPIPGNGVLGTVVHGQTVTIVAENQYYYFFVTQDGRAGWNGKSYFKDP